MAGSLSYSNFTCLWDSGRLSQLLEQIQKNYFWYFVFFSFPMPTESVSHDLISTGSSNRKRLLPSEQQEHLVFLIIVFFRVKWEIGILLEKHQNLMISISRSHLSKFTNTIFQMARAENRTGVTMKPWEWPAGGSPEGIASLDSKLLQHAPHEIKVVNFQRQRSWAPLWYNR